MAGTNDSLINRKNTITSYMGKEGTTDITAEDLLGNVSSMGEIGGTAGDIEIKYYDTGSNKFPDEPTYDAFDVEQNLLKAKIDTLSEYFENGTTFPFAIFWHKKDGSILVGRKCMGHLASLKLPTGAIGDNMLIKYSVQPENGFEAINSEPTATVTD